MIIDLVLLYFLGVAISTLCLNIRALYFATRLEKFLVVTVCLIPFPVNMGIILIANIW